ncbi:MAG: DUF6036 family nucleotidyltransferase [Planctomycetota bacterium]|jgi:hypothetical protein
MAMTRDELEHAIRAACDVADDTEIYVFGSQAVLGQYPDPPEALCQSAEVDVMPKNRPDRVDRIDGALGELSQFHQAFGFYVHGVSLETAVLPDGWEDRLIVVRNENTRQCTGWCVEGHDLLAEGLIDADTLASRIRALAVSPDDRERLTTWVAATCQELD